jgi:hypothetical protein
VKGIEAQAEPLTALANQHSYLEAVNVGGTPDLIPVKMHDKHKLT